MNRTTARFGLMRRGLTVHFEGNDGKLLIGEVYGVEDHALALITAFRTDGRDDLPSFGSLFWLLGTYNRPERASGATFMVCPHVRGFIDLDGSSIVEIALPGSEGKTTLLNVRTIEVYEGNARLSPGNFAEHGGVAS